MSHNVYLQFVLKPINLNLLNWLLNLVTAVTLWFCVASYISSVMTPYGDTLRGALGLLLVLLLFPLSYNKATGGHLSFS